MYRKNKLTGPISSNFLVVPRIRLLQKKITYDCKNWSLYYHWTINVLWCIFFQMTLATTHLMETTLILTVTNSTSVMAMEIREWSLALLEPFTIPIPPTAITQRTLGRNTLLIVHKLLIPLTMTPPWVVLSGERCWTSDTNIILITYNW